MDKNLLIAGIAYMPKSYEDLQTVTLCEILKKIGYFDFYDQVSEKDIELFLRKNPECIQLWLQYSADQRTDGIWYFLKLGEGSYEVAYHDKAVTKFQNKFTDSAEACAFYIKKEIEDLREFCISRN